jgi:glycosyltransferase involved in cell wall biosynthesis
MKIAVWHNLPSGGGKRALLSHVKGLVERGHHLEVWCPPTADLSYCPLGEFSREHIVPLSWPENLGSKIVGGLRHGPSLGKINAMDRHCRQCAEEINRGGYDLLFANSCMLFGVSPIARYVKVPAVAYLQEPYRLLYEALPRLPWVASDGPEAWWDSGLYLGRRVAELIRVRARRLQAREELRNAGAFCSILVNSRYSRESFLRAFGLDASVCYLGVDTKLFKNQRMPREDFVVGIGAFLLTKNIHFVIRAVACLREPRPRLVWIGNSAYASYLRELTELARSQGVEFEPKLRIPDAELVSILNRAKIMLYAPRLEPFGFAPLEANACGVPVVAVAEGGVRETVIDGVTGLLVDHDPASMGTAVERLFNDPVYARHLGETGSKMVVERWSIEDSIDRLENSFVKTLQLDQAKSGGTRCMIPGP